MNRRVLCRMLSWLATLALFSGLTACGPAVNAALPVKTIVINPRFQSQVSPLPTIPPGRCGAWASNNAPGTFSTIVIYARLTHNAVGIGGIRATAVVHFQRGDAAIGQATSDAGGYVSFPLNLMGRQPARVPATVDITFNGLPSGPLQCSSAFFTPL